MPIKSYLAIAHKGKKEVLQQTLNALPTCECTPAENKDVLVLITETETDAEDKILFKNINKLEDLLLLTLVSAFSNDSTITA